MSNSTDKWKSKFSNPTDRTPLGSGGDGHRKDKTNIEIQNSPPHLSDAEDTGGKLETLYQNHKAHSEQKQRGLESTGTLYQEDQQEYNS